MSSVEPDVTPFYGPALATCELRDVAACISNAWTKHLGYDWRQPARGGTKFCYAAHPYLEAMLTLESIDDAYYQDRGRDIVAYFLSNVNSWKGPEARQLKAELRRRLAATS